MTETFTRFAASLALGAVLTLAATANSGAQQPYYGGGYGPGYGAGPGYGYGRPMMPGYPQARPQRQPGPQEIVGKGIAKVRAFLAKGGADDPVATAAFVEKVVAPYFDFEYMAQWAVGARGRGLGEAAQAQLTAKLATHFTSTLAKHLGGYGQARIHVSQARPGRQDGTIEVPVTVSTPQSRPLALGFRFYRDRSGAWKVYDVTANGQSALLFYRGYFQRSAR